MSARYLPKTLQEQEQHDEFFDFEPPFDQELVDCRSGQRATVTSSTSRWYIENKQSAFLRPLMPAPQP